MFSEINKQLQDAQEGAARYRKIDAKIRDLVSERASLISKITELKNALDKELCDVQKIENKSVASIFYSVLGTLPEHINKEKKEALAAQLKYDQAQKSLESINAEITKLSAEKDAYLDCQKTYDLLYSQKEKEILSRSGSTSQEILKLTADLNAAKIQLKEINEAITAGNEVIKCLNNAVQSLSSAKGWGTWDMLGGGLITDIVKHSHIDDAKTQSGIAQNALLRFKSELADIKIDAHMAFETDGFVKFADFFFDGLIADWIMQSKINSSLDSVENVKNQVLDVLSKLETMQKNAYETISKLDGNIKETVLNEQ